MAPLLHSAVAAELKKNSKAYYEVLEAYTDASLDVILHTVLSPDSLANNNLLTDAWNDDIDKSSNNARWCAALYMSWLLAVFLAETLFQYFQMCHVMRTLYHRVVSSLTVRKSPLQDNLPPMGTGHTLRML